MTLPLQMIPPVAGLPPAHPDPAQSPDQKVQPVTASDGASVHTGDRPPDRPFLAQAVAARLQGTGFAETPGEIRPDDRRLRPYGVPMLPADPPQDGMTAPPENAAETSQEQKD
jgi:hypothetical protein